MAAYDATDLDRVKAWMGTANISDPSTLDAQLTPLITAVSRALEGPNVLNRELEAKARTEVYRLGKYRTRSLSLRHYPVSVLTTLKTDTKADWTNATTLDGTTDYLLHPASGLVDLYAPLLGPTYVQAVYTAGLAANLAALETAYPAIVHAATMWVCEVFRRRENITKRGETNSRTGAITWGDDLQHPPKAVMGLLYPHVRRSIRA